MIEKQRIAKNTKYKKKQDNGIRQSFENLILQCV